MTLAAHNNDVLKYLLMIKNKLRMMTSPTQPASQTHHGLLVYILRQLKQTQIVAFQEYIRDLHIQFQEGKLSDKSPSALITAIEDCIRILQHAGEWTDTSTSSDVNPMALFTTSTNGMSPSIKAYIDQIVDQHLKTLTPPNAPNPTGLLNNGKLPPNRPKIPGRFHKEWMFIPPKLSTQQLTYNNSTFYWCTKCNNGAGQWVTSHQTSTHVDGFCHPRSRAAMQPTNPGQHLHHPHPKPYTTPSGHPSTFQHAPRFSGPPRPRLYANLAQDQPSTDARPSAQTHPPEANITPDQLCLAAGIENCFDLLDYDNI
jgi:hypothetical protein